MSIKSLVSTIALGVLLSSCAESRLYYWGSNPSSDKATKYEQLTYKYYDKQTPESLCSLIVLYEEMVNEPGGKRKVVPPGICAEYGYLLLQPTTADIFAQYATSRQKKKFDGSDYGNTFHEKGLLMMQKEIELYPESVKFIEPILKKLNRQ